MFKFHFSYRDPKINDKFLRGKNIHLDTDSIVRAIQEFQREFPDCEIMGILKTKEQ